MEQSLLEEVPEKIHGPTKPTMSKSPRKLEYLLDQDEVNRLIKASNEPYVDPSKQPKPHTNYPTFTMEEVNALLDGDYDPTRFKKRR